MVSTIINSQPKSFTNLCFTGTNWAKELKEEKTPSLDLAGDNLTHTVLEKDPFGKITYPYIDAITVATKKNRYGYGKDDITELASKKMREIFGLNTIFCPMLTGSAANVTILAALINPTEKILCSDMAHINCMESNFYSLVTGTHSLQVPSKDGKIIFEELEKKLNDYVSESSTRSIPKILMIANPTEIGTLYTPDEVKKLADFAHKHDMIFVMDGARIFNNIAEHALNEKNIDLNNPKKAEIYLKEKLKALTLDLGVDALSLGGTKNGMVLAESILFFDNPESPIHDLMKNKNFKQKVNIWKRQLGQVNVKNSLISAQYLTGLEDGLAMKTAINSNEMAKYLKESMEQKDLEIIYPVDTNSVFLSLPKGVVEKIKDNYKFYLWNKTDPKNHNNSIIRFMTSPSTTKETIDKFIDNLSIIQKELE